MIENITSSLTSLSVEELNENLISIAQVKSIFTSDESRHQQNQINIQNQVFNQKVMQLETGWNAAVKGKNYYKQQRRLNRLQQQASVEKLTSVRGGREKQFSSVDMQCKSPNSEVQSVYTIKELNKWNEETMSHSIDSTIVGSRMRRAEDRTSFATSRNRPPSLNLRGNLKVRVKLPAINVSLPDAELMGEPPIQKKAKRVKNNTNMEDYLDVSHQVRNKTLLKSIDVSQLKGNKRLLANSTDLRMSMQVSSRIPSRQGAKTGDLDISFGRKVPSKLVKVNKERYEEKKEIMERKYRLNQIISRGIQFTDILLNRDERKREKLIMTADVDSPSVHPESAVPNIDIMPDLSPYSDGQDNFSDEEADSVVFGDSNFGMQRQGGQYILTSDQTPGLMQKSTERKTRAQRSGSSFFESPCAFIPAKTGSKMLVMNGKQSKNMNKTTVQEEIPEDIIRIARSALNSAATTLTNFPSLFSDMDKLDEVKQFQRYGEFTVRPPPPETQLRMDLRAYEIEEDHFQRLISDNRVLSLAKISLQYTENKDEKYEKQKEELEQIVCFLLSAEKNQSEMVKKVTEKLIKQVYQETYNTYVQDTEALAIDFAKEIRDKKVHYDMCKQSQNTQVQYNNRHNYLFRYFQETKKNGVVPLPILFKVKNRRLDLKGYVLNDGICKSFAEAISLWDQCKHEMEDNSEFVVETVLNSIILENNGLKDQQTASLLKGLAKVQEMKQIVIKKNEFMDESLKQLEALLVRPFPGMLDELRLVSTKTSPLTTTSLCQSLVRFCHLRKLALVDIQLANTNANDLCKIIKEARFLEELDISQNHLTHPYMLVLTEHLAENRQLRTVNLSWNFLSTQRNRDYIEMVDNKDDGQNNIEVDCGNSSYRGCTQGSNDSLGQLDNHGISVDNLPETDQLDTKIIIDRKLSSSMLVTDRGFQSRNEGQLLDQNSTGELKVPGTQDGRSLSKMSAQKSLSSKEKELKYLGKTMKEKMAMSFQDYEFTLTVENKKHKGVSCLQCISQGKKIKVGKSTMVPPQCIAKNNLEIIKNLERFIKRNKNLIHLDLSQTNLTELMLWRIGSALSRAKSLVSIHFSGNQGITPAVKDQLFKRIHCRESIEHKITHPIGEYKEGTDCNNLTMMDRAHMMSSEMFFKENMQIRQQNKQSLTTATTNLGIVEEDKVLIFERQLGHKSDIPGIGQWRQLHDSSQKCWICANYMYTLVFWSKQQGWADEEAIEPQVEENLIQQIEEYNDKNVLDEQDDPFYCCQATGWQAKPLLPLSEFFFNIDKNKPDFIEFCKEKCLVREEVQEFSDLNETEKEAYVDLQQQYKKRHYSSSEDIKRIIIRDMLYPKMQFINADLILNLDNNAEDYDRELNKVYAFVQLMKPGRQMYAMCVPEDDKELGMTYFTHKTIIHKREEDVNLFVKAVKINTNVRKFNRETSVFKDWKVDTKDDALQCIEHDLSLWNEKFCKNPEQLNALKDVIRQYADELKSSYLSIASRSEFPQISMLDFSMWAKDTKIVDDKNVPSQYIDIWFTQVTSNLAAPKVPGFDTTSLMRYNFIELVVRIANGKYESIIKKNETTSYAQALEKLLTEVILENAQQEPMQLWREKELWTLDVGDCMYANFDLIKKLHTAYIQHRQTSMHKADAIRLFTEDASLITTKECVYCYGLSKMTVIYESVKFANYDQFKVPELCEMIGRVADLKYKTQVTLTLKEKIEFILDALFKVIGQERQKVIEQIEDESVSEDDY